MPSDQDVIQLIMLSGQRCLLFPGTAIVRPHLLAAGVSGKEFQPAAGFLVCKTGIFGRIEVPAEINTRRAELPAVHARL